MGTVVGDLPLVVANYADLQQLAEILFEWQNLPNSPFMVTACPGILLVLLVPCLDP